ncbi:slit homolog 2 protein-like isoform X2 [Ostrea edulis]|uniref:slit homolog 2 protein-like isoform X2 n=1 Tax=Ostrea edulis TaxID=37623 RepID=UPI0020944888|nr:slit homolog 2 protein-like isoform X2 [Ostrea edulis]
MAWLEVFIFCVMYSRGTEACSDQCSCSRSSYCSGTYVNCVNRGLTRVPISIPEDTCELNLSSNNITMVEQESFQGLANLYYLFLYNNKITMVEKRSFEGLVNLQELYLSDNEITIVEKGSFKGLTNLKNLILTRNEITMVEQGSFEGLANLQHLDLEDNLLQSVKKDLMEQLPKLKRLALERNPLQCGCQLVAFLTVAKTRSLKLKFENDVEPSCHTPRKLNGTLLKALKLRKMTRNYSTTDVFDVQDQVKDFTEATIYRDDFDDQVSQQSPSISMGTNWARLLDERFLLNGTKSKDST